MKKLILLGLVAALAACKKEGSPLSPVPKLEVVSMGPGVVREFKDSLVIVLDYQDGDGDLGGIPADSNNLFVIDNRIDVPFAFRIQELVPGGAEVPIKGRINLVLQNLYLTGSAQQEQLNFDIYAIDKAGNMSNRITTENISVVK